MCGIAGIVDFTSASTPPLEAIKRMTDVLLHRGPDASGYHVGPYVGLGHRRLSIIDLSTGQQPMYSDDDTMVIVFNGEIYNFESLRSTLESLGHLFRTKSDTEVILKAFECFGERCLKHLRGMFAFAVWDSVRERLFVARDRLGKKPFYYYSRNGKLIFSSEIKSILQTEHLRFYPDLDALDTFLSLGYTLCPDTAFHGIKKLQPGHYLVFDRSGLIIHKYWALHEHDTQPKLGSQESVDTLKETLKQAVTLRMISDVPLGAYLSGGIDSSIVVGIMSEVSSNPVRTFTIGYENAPEYSELRFAGLVAKHFKTDHTEIIVKPPNFFDLLKKMTFHLEEPIGDQACIPLFLISQEAKKYVTVMLSGEGADELFAGYNIYILMQSIELLRRLPRLVRRRAITPLLLAIIDERRGKKYAEWLEMNLSSRYLGDMADLSLDLKSKLYTKEFYHQTSRSYMRIIRDIYKEVEHSSALDQMTYLDIKTWLVEDLLLKADKMTMAASIELRTPFLDHELAEISRRIPSKMKIKGWKKKHILKTAYKEMLPTPILRRSKKGFPVPLALWFRDSLNGHLHDVLLSNKARQRGYFNTKFIEYMLDTHRKGNIDYSKTLWSLLTLEFWHREFIDRQEIDS